MLLIHRLFLKTALIYLLLGAVAGGWLLLEQAGVLPAAPKSLFTVHIHLIGIGFFLELVCGVALWMFPRKSGESRQEAAREPLAWTTYFLLTVGVAVRTVALLLPNVFGSAVLAGCALLQVGGVLAFVLAIWPRIYLPGAKLAVATPAKK